jgi:hypothetical protein
MNHHFYATKLPREVFVGITSIFSYVSGLGGPLLRALLEHLETTLPRLLFAILSECKGDNITHQKVFNQLLLLINARGGDRSFMRQLVRFAFAHVHARQSEGSCNMQFATNEYQPIMHLVNNATLFSNTFDIPSVLDRMHNEPECWRSISVRSTTNNFVVYRQHPGSESKTLRVGESIAVVLNLLQRPRPRGWILRKFPVADRPAIADALNDLVERGVLGCRTSDDPNCTGSSGAWKKTRVIPSPTGIRMSLPPASLLRN